MNTLTILMGVLLAGHYAVAEGTDSSVNPYSTSEKVPASVRSDDSSLMLTTTNGKAIADVVASSETSKTITVRPPAETSSSAYSSSPSVTVPVEGKALASLKSIQGGERVSLTCRTSGASTSTSDGSTAGNTGSMGAEPSIGRCNSVTDISKVKATTQD
jgi:hypothetical protein